MIINDTFEKIKRKIRRSKKRKANISRIVSATGWDKNTAEKKMDIAKSKGIPNWQYVKNAGWEMTNDELDEFAKRLKKHKKTRSLMVEIVCDQTGWTYEKAKADMDRFRAEGVTYDNYVSKRFYASSETKQQEKISKLKEKDSEYIDRVSEATGWSREESLEEMERVRKKLGVSHFKYCSYRFFTNTDEEIKERLEKWKNTASSQIDYVAEQSGWDRRKVRFHMNKVRTVYDIPPDYYVLYEMWELSDDEINTYARRKDSDRLFAKYNNKEETYILKKKELFDEHYKDYIKRKFWINRDTNIDEFKEFIDGLEFIFCKPIDSGGGQGTEKIKIAEHDINELYEYLIGKDKLLVEECVVQHHEIDAFIPGCVNTIRVITLMKDDECHIICAGLRVGHKGIVDNFHADGMVCDIDIDTGIVVTHAIDRSGVTYEKHPVSGIQFKGFRIPNWDMVKKLALDAIKVQPGVNYVGWDIAVCEDKAVIIEGNSAPDLVLVQAPYAREKKGMKYLFKPYF